MLGFWQRGEPVVRDDLRTHVGLCRLCLFAHPTQVCGVSDIRSVFSTLSDTGFCQVDHMIFTRSPCSSSEAVTRLIPQNSCVFARAYQKNTSTAKMRTPRLFLRFWGILGPIIQQALVIDAATTA